MTNFDFTQSEQYSLSIRLSADGFSFSVHSPSDTEHFFHIPYPVNGSISLTANIKKMLSSAEVLKHSFQQTNLLIDTPRFTPVPFDLFEDEQAEELFYHTYPKNDNETVLCNILAKSHTALLFGMDRYAHQLLDEHFPHARILACVSPLMEHFAQQSRESYGRKLFAHFREDKMEVFAFDKGKLLFVNTFVCQHTSDRTYYLLYIWQLLGFKQEQDQLALAGTIQAKEELTTDLNRFLKQVKFLPSQEPLPFDIQTLMICE